MLYTQATLDKKLKEYKSDFREKISKEYLDRRESYEKMYQEEEYDRNLDHRRELEKKDYKIKVLEAQKDQEILDAVAKIKAQLDDKIVECKTLKSETDLLNKAFDNLGFDVKDMKDMLGKLVDGVVAKNQVKVIK